MGLFLVRLSNKSTKRKNEAKLKKNQQFFKPKKSDVLKTSSF